MGWLNIGNLISHGDFCKVFSVIQFFSRVSVWQWGRPILAEVDGVGNSDWQWREQE